MRSLVLSESPDRVAVVLEDSIRIYERGVPTPLSIYQELAACVSLSVDGRVGAIGCRDGDLLLFEVGKPGLRRIANAHQGPVSACCLVGGRVISGGKDRTLAVWNADGGLVTRFRGHLFRIAEVSATDEGEYLVSAGSNGALLAWENPVGSSVSPPAPWLDCCVVRPASMSQRSSRVGLPPVIAYVGSVSADARLRLWIGTADGFTRRTLGPARFQCCAVSPDGSWIAGGTENGEMLVYATEGGAVGRSIQAHDTRVRACAWSAAGDLLASVGDDRRIMLYPADGEPWVLAGHASETRTCTFLPNDPLRLVTTSSDGDVVMWEDVRNGKILARERFPSPPLCCRSLNSTHALFGCRDGTVMLWDGKSKPKAILRQGAPIRDLAVVGIGQHIVTASDDETVSVWHTGEGRRLGRVYVPGRVNCIDADDDLVVAGDSTGNLYALDFVAPVYLKNAQRPYL